MKLIDRLLDPALALRAQALPQPAIDAATTFITDTVAVGVAGSRHPRVSEVVRAARAWGSGHDAPQWATGERWSAPSAALINAYQVHNQEFDCVHERAVVHPMATILPALLAVAQRIEAQGREVRGAALIEAVVAAVDVAATIGSAQIAPMRFFRPAMCGALGASVGVSKLLGLDRERMADALGIAYSQLAGTMQAHLEGSPMLALQVGLASRAAVTAADLAAEGFAGPRDVLEGPFGYFELFDAPLAPRLADVQRVFGELADRHRISEVSHKPYPTGRAAQGALDGLQRLRQAHGFTAAQVRRVTLAAPPLVLRLVGRPMREAMDINYARLCLPYLAATMLLEGEVGLADFSRAALDDPARRELARHIHWEPNGVSDPNALAPQDITVELVDGGQHRIELPTVLGHPDRPLSAVAQRAKFDACCAFAGLCGVATERLHAACRELPRAASLQSLTLALVQ